MIRNIVFDMGGVLIGFNEAQLLRHYCEGEDDRQRLEREVLRSVEWVRCDRGSLAVAEAIAITQARVPERLRGIVADIYLRWHKAMAIFPETNDLALWLKEAGYGVYLLSNAAESFYQYCDIIPALKAFDGLFVSSDWGLLKPQPEIYRAFCAHFSLVPAHCFFTDDNPMNIEAALHAGMKGCVFHGDTKELIASLQAEGVRI